MMVVWLSGSTFVLINVVDHSA